MNFTLGTEIARRGGLHEVGKGESFVSHYWRVEHRAGFRFVDWSEGRLRGLARRVYRALLAKLPGHCGVRPRKERRRYGLAGCAAAQIADEATS